MTAGEKRWLTAGIALGTLMAVAVYEIQHSYQSGGRALIERPSSDGAPASDTANAAVQLTGEEQKSIGVETVVVTRRAITKDITSPGKVAEAETGIAAISARISGRIEKLFLNVTGETVNRGQPVALIYSPEVFAAGEEYKLALEHRERLSASKEPQAITNADDLVRAGRKRLELRGLTAQQIDDIVSSPDKSIQIATFSPVSGIVTKRHAAEGQYVKEGDILYDVADLSTVWLQAEIFETDIPLIRTGQSASITASTLPGTLRGNISFLQPSVDPQTRTMTARIQVANPQMRLRPGMFALVTMQASLGPAVVAVPRSAVLETGQEKVVYVAKENGVFEKRTIEASSTGDEYYAVTRGIEPGERVVTRGNFLIDSQARLAGNLTGLFGGSKSFGTEPAAAAAGYTISLRLDPSPPKGSLETTVHVTVTGPDGKAVADAQVQITMVMPAMPAMGMGEMRSSINLMWNGTEYAGSGSVAIAGPWNVIAEARRSGQLLAVYRGRFDAK